MTTGAIGSSGFRQLLANFAQSIGYDASKISQMTETDWQNTKTRLEYIQKDRTENNLNSIYDASGNLVTGSDGLPQLKNGEWQSVFVSMGLQNKAEGYEKWNLGIRMSPTTDFGSYKVNKDGNTDPNAYNAELSQMARDYIKLYDLNGDGKISVMEFMGYEYSQGKTHGLSDKEIMSQMGGVMNTFVKLDINDSGDSQKALDEREITNFFFTMDSLDSTLKNNKNPLGNITQDEYMTMITELAKQPSQNDIAFLLRDHYQRLFGR